MHVSAALLPLGLRRTGGHKGSGRCLASRPCTRALAGGWALVVPWDPDSWGRVLKWVQHSRRCWKPSRGEIWVGSMFVVVGIFIFLSSVLFGDFPVVLRGQTKTPTIQVSHRQPCQHLIKTKKRALLHTLIQHCSQGLPQSD